VNDGGPEASGNGLRGLGGPQKVRSVDFKIVPPRQQSRHTLGDHRRLPSTQLGQFGVVPATANTLDVVTRLRMGDYVNVPGQAGPLQAAAPSYSRGSERASNAGL